MNIQKRAMAARCALIVVHPIIGMIFSGRRPIVGPDDDYDKRTSVSGGKATFMLEIFEQDGKAEQIVIVLLSPINQVLWARA